MKHTFRTPIFVLVALALVVSPSTFTVPFTEAHTLTSTDSLVAHWTFDEGAGDTVADSSGNGNDIIIDDATWTEGRNDTSALSFDGVDDIATFSPMDLGLVHTLSVWIKSDGSKDGIVIGKTGEGYLMYFDADNVYYNSGGNSGGGSGSDFVSVSHGGLSESDWTHFVIRRTNDFVLMYKNGERLADGHRLATETPINDVRAMGGYIDNPTGDFHGKFMIDDVRIYTRPLDDDEVMAIYNDSSSTPNTPPRISLNTDGSGNVDMTLYVGDTFIDPGVTVEDDEDSVDDLTISTTTDPIGGIETSTESTFSLTYTVTDTGLLSASVIRTINIIASTTATSTATSTDPETDTDTNTETATSTATTTPDTTDDQENTGPDTDADSQDEDTPRKRTGSRARSVSSRSVGQVLGAFVGPGGSIGPIGSIASTSCTSYLDGSLIGVGYENKPEQVDKLKAFLNEYIGSKMPLNGKLDAETVIAVKEFQEKFKSDIITPLFKSGALPSEKPTGFVNTMTIRKINSIVCPLIN